ncbi:hypothetical protein BCR44DRAFT_1008906 [Catenaria anguillulae PL171]|uniref:Poly(A) RNA polymerase mitochondrial-like central palm domain-containing protein n=1 Tax=Catenaria anguillulae PL171 TaxID=765915 RepID=A0A1Y2I3U1_9FUNG|nr:hypothetical protein BCR44DRAFT_1008906 [Catenaria anguillulae PL171]
MYPEDVRFRPFYFQDQAIPIPADSAVLFPPPWTPASWDQACEPPAHPVSMFTRLSLELFAFSEHVKMSPVDEFLRTCAYARLEAMVSRLLPDGCEMFVFGSSASPLSNPNSDLDVGIFPRNPNNLTLESGRQQARKILDTLFRYILVIAAPRSVESVFHAKVPLIKYTDRATGVEVDVSVQWEGGESVDIVYALAAKYPALVPMVRTVKSMLSLHALNSGRDGGIHGFCVLSMVAGFLGRLEAMGLGVGVKVTEREGKVYPPPHMHGLAFLAFLHFVGFVWDPATTGMDNTNGGALFYRHAKCDREYQNHILLVTSVRPQATPENVGRSVRAETWVAFRSICQNAFMRLYQCARTQIAPPAPGAPYGQAEQHGSSSLLGLFLTVPPMYRKAMEAAEAAIDTFSQYSKFEGVGDFNTWVEMVLSKERAYFRRKFEEVKEQMDRRGGGGRGGGNQGQGGRGGGARVHFSSDMVVGIGCVDSPVEGCALM